MRIAHRALLRNAKSSVMSLRVCRVVNQVEVCAKQENALPFGSRLNKCYLRRDRPSFFSTESTFDCKRPLWPFRQSIFTVQAMRVQSFDRSS
jgi:hypothetical protein